MTPTKPLKTDRIDFRLDPALKQKLKKWAKIEKRTLSDFIVLSLAKVISDREAGWVNS